MNILDFLHTLPISFSVHYHYLLVFINVMMFKLDICGYKTLIKIGNKSNDHQFA